MKKESKNKTNLYVRPSDLHNTLQKDACALFSRVEFSDLLFNIPYVKCKYSNITWSDVS